MTGRLYVKKDKYYVVISFKNENNCWKKKWISTGLSSIKNNKRKAEQMLRDLLDEYKNAENSLNENLTFVQLLYRFLDIVKLRIDISTYESYEHLVTRHLIPYFSKKNKRVNDINVDDIQQYYLYKLKNGRLDGKGGLSANTIKHHHVVISQALNYAVKNKIISSNPATYVVLPKIERYKANYYSIDEINLLLSASKGEIIESIIYLAVFYGLRRSEVVGLKWNAIDFKEHKIYIQHTVVRSFSLVKKDKTKNESSRRIYPLTQEIEILLLKLKKEQKENRLLYGKNYNQNKEDYVFLWPDGHQIAPDYVSQRFKAILENNSLRHIRFHDLRHSCASMLLSYGFEIKDVQDWLGHENIITTGNIYGHLAMTRKEKMAQEYLGILKVQ